MEFLEGETLSQRLRRGKLPPRDCAQIGVQLARALDYAHQQGILHRDVKPSNIWLAKDGRAMVMDFGLARDAAAVTLTLAGVILGTPAYMSPEQAEGKLDLDGRCDLYSLGATLYEAATGRMPFEGDSITAVIAKVVSTPPQPMKDVPPDFEKVVLRSMEKLRDHRYPRGNAMAVDLEAFLEGKPVVGAAQSGVTKAMRPAGWRPGVVAAVAAVAVLAIGGPLAWRALRHHDAPPAPPAAPESPLDRARRALGAGELEKAMSALNYAITESPSAEAYRLRARLGAGQDRPQAALEDYGKAVGLDPKDPALHVEFGRFLLILRQPFVAMDQFRKAIETGGETPESVALRALASALSGIITAPADIAAALQKDVRNSDAQAALAVLLVSREEWAPAYEAAGRALDQDPRHLWALGARARAAAELRQDEEAEKLYRRVLKEEAGNHEALTGLGTLLASTEPEEALKLLDRALAGRDDDADVWVARATADAALWDYARAVEDCRHALDIDEDHGQAALDLERYQKKLERK